MRTLLRLFIVVVGMAGLRLDRGLAQILATMLGIVLSIQLALSLCTTREHALAYVALVWCVYYLFHTFFFHFGLHHKLRSALGDRRAWAIYEAVLGVVFFNQGWCQAIFLEHYGDSLGLGLSTALMQCTGVALILVGTVTKIWATWEVGLDVYFYRDLFHDAAPEGGLITTGPYTYLSNPMYGIGLITMYGAAVYERSWEGLMLALIFQASIYLFYVAVERPFIRSRFPA